MIESVRFHPLAIRELAEHFRTYREIAPTLGADFLDEVDRVLHLLQAFPEITPMLRPPHRRYPLTRFPYQVIYEVDDSGMVFVVAVAHRRRHPDFGTDRR